MCLYVVSNIFFLDFESWITGVCSLYVVLCVILHTMWLGNNLQLLCILLVSILCLSAIRTMSDFENQTHKQVRPLVKKVCLILDLSSEVMCIMVGIVV